MYSDPDASTDPDVPVWPTHVSQSTPQTRRRWVWGPALVGGTIVIIAIGVAGITAFSSNGGRTSAPLATAGATLCRAWQKPDYGAVWSTFGAQLQQFISPSMMVTIGTALEHDRGKVSACVMTDFSVTNDIGTSTLQIAFGTRPATLYPVHWDKEAAGWKVTEITGMPLVPMAISDTFCTDLLAGNQGEAYQLLAPTTQQRIGSVSNFGNSINGLTFLTGNFIACTLTGAPDTAPDNATVTMSVDYERVKNVAYTITLVPASDQAWLIDHLTYLVLGTPVQFPAPQ